MSDYRESTPLFFPPPSRENYPPEGTPSLYPDWPKLPNEDEDDE